MQHHLYKFQVRIGINSNQDNIVTVVNGRRNVAGAGINIVRCAPERHRMAPSVGS